MHVIAVLGKKLLPSGKMNDEFVSQMNKAIKRLERTADSLMVISGGQTRAGFLSESETALQMVPERLKGLVRLEKHSRTTSENVKFMRKLFAGVRIDSLTIISGAAHEPRTRFLLKRFWPEVYPKVSFDNVPSPTRDWVIHSVLYALTVLDPNDAVFVPIAKKLLRNA